jgi:aminomethyltransferase
MTDFNGWSMPLYYTGITAEHLATRRAGGLFDLGHMGRLVLRGARAHAFADYLTPARIAGAETNSVLYSFLLDEAGHTIDDITVYVGADQVMLVINAGNHDRVVVWVEEHARAFGGVEVEDRSFSWGMIAVQGPAHEAAMRALLGEAFEALPYYHFREVQLSGGESVMYSATGYTGEAGYEVYAPAERLRALWEAAVAGGAPVGVIPAGLGARDSLRLEAAMPLYGHELTADTSPLEAGLARFIAWDKPAFIGRDALVRLRDAGKPARQIVAFEMERRGPVARQGFAVMDGAGSRVGVVTSGILSPMLQKVIGLARVDSAVAAVGTPLQVEIRGSLYGARVVKKPFYKRSRDHAKSA